MRVPDLHAFRRAIAALSPHDGANRVESRAIIVPTRGAARQLARSIERSAGTAWRVTRLPHFVTRDELYDRLHLRLSSPPRRLSPYERDVILRASAREASTGGAGSSFRLRPGLLAEILRFYDQLRRQSRNIQRFEGLLEGRLGQDAEYDRGAERMLHQTRFLAATFRAYERRVVRSGACDEHTLRERLLADPSPDPMRDIVITVADWIADPNGLFLADFDLLTRLPGVETVDLLATETLLASGFHQRIHDWLPGLEEMDAGELGVGSASTRPRLVVPAGTLDRPWFLSRDREEELIAVARRLKADRRERARTGAEEPQLDRTAVVFKRPLPYLYLGREVFGGTGIPYQASDGLPLAAEPFAAALDLVFECVASAFTRETLVALLRSPQFSFEHDGEPVTRDAIAALDRALSEARYLGEIDRLSQLAETWPTTDLHVGARPALCAALAVARWLSPLRMAAPASSQIRLVLSFLDAHRRWQASDEASSATAALEDSLSPHEPQALVWRQRRTRAAIVDALEALATANARHGDAPSDVDQLAAVVRRWIEEQTFAPDSADSGLQLLDDQAARYGDFDEIAIVGLIEGEWLERPCRNIFYPSALLTSLGWPSENDRRGAAQARFIELLASPWERVTVSAFTLDEEAFVEPSTLLDELPRARLSLIARDAAPGGRIFAEEALSLDPTALHPLEPDAREWAEMRLARSAAHDPAFHGQTSSPAARPWSVGALETYLECPFKFFAQRVLRLEEEPADEEVMDPRKQGQFVHDVFQAFFDRWQDSGHQAITPDQLDEARGMFVEVVENRLAAFSETEAALERTRLLGSPAATGLGEAVLRMEAERPTAVVRRLLEHALEGHFSFETANGPRVVALRGKADRLDLLADGTFRLIDYKLGWPPNRTRALQLPIYGLCAEQRLDGHFGRRWTLGEAAYLAFKGPKRVVPLFSPGDRARVLGDAQNRLVAAIDAIGRGEFPPRPDDMYRCETCTYVAVCRKDYVGDV